MNWDLSCRIASVAITALLVVLIADYSQWVSLVIGFGFAHYLLSFYYARAGIKTILASPTMQLPLASLAALLGVIYFLDFPLEIYFGVHHACNEAYLKRRASGVRSDSCGQLNAARALLQLAAYFCILRHDPMVGQLPVGFLGVFLGIAFTIYLVQLRAARPQSRDTLAWMLKESGVESIALLVVGLSFFVEITFLQIVMFHFILWTVVPLPAMRQKGANQLAEYGLLTAGALLFFIVLTMSQLFSSYFSLSFFYSQFIIWSYIHITTSFALSSAHPQWIVQLFRAPPEVAH